MKRSSCRCGLVPHVLTSTTPARLPSAGVILRSVLPAVLVACMLATPAGAATYTSSVSPDPFSYPGMEQVVYRLHITTGGQAEQLRVSASSPDFPGQGEFLRLQSMALEGSGTVLTGGSSVLHADRFCAPPFPDMHGEGSFISRPFVTVEIPANTTSTVALAATPAGDAPWPGMDLAVDFQVGPPTAPGQSVRSISPQNSGLHGVPISVSTDPAGEPYGCGLSTPPSVAFGKPVLVRGRADPVIAGQLLTIRAARGRQAPAELATVRVGEGGLFSYLWQPAVPGEYAVGAFYRSQSAQLTDDFSNAMRLRIAPPTTRPPSRVAPSALTAVPRVRCSGRRCVIVVRGRISRPRAVPACTGTGRLRVAAGRRRVLSVPVTVARTCRYRVVRRFTLPSERRRFITVRVSYLGDGVLLPKRGSAVRVRIGR